MSSAKNTLYFQGCSLFRQRITSSLLSCKNIKISNIRDQDESPGLQEFEASFLRLIEQITDGCNIEINETGTSLRFKPGVLTGGMNIVHNCGVGRSIGWFIEGILPIAVFCKNQIQLTLHGITNDSTDLSVDIIKTVTIPLLQNFGIFGIELKIIRRGCAPKGGGIVTLVIPPIKQYLRSIHVTEEGLVKRIRGVAFCSKVSPNIVIRVVDSCRAVLNNVLPDVFINTDHYKGKEGGDSPGYSLSLVAETTSGVLLSVERTANCLNITRDNSSSKADLPEDVGKECAVMLLNEIYRGGTIDSMHQSLILQLMTLTPEDISKVRFGSLTGQSILVLRLLKEAFGIIFKIKEDRDIELSHHHNNIPRNSNITSTAISNNNNITKKRTSDPTASDDLKKVKFEDPSIYENNEINDKYDEENQLHGNATSLRSTILLSCYGIGYSNIYRRIT